MLDVSTVKQGGYGSCFFLSSVVALALKNQAYPDIIIGADYCEAKFFLRTKRCWRIQTKTIRTDKSLTPQSSKSEIVGLLEKCYGEFIGGMAQYERGGYPWIAMYDLTGKEPGLSYSTSANFREVLLKNRGAAMVADSKGEDLLSQYAGCRITPRHSYTVMSVDNESVILRNPWGFFEPIGDGIDDGVFRLSWDSFAKYFIRVSFL